MITMQKATMVDVLPLGWYQPDDAPLQLNGCLLAALGLLKLVASSSAESELVGLFCSAQDRTILCFVLNEMGPPQTDVTPSTWTI